MIGSIYKLHLELDINDADIKILKKVAKVEKGITRDVLVPSTITLHALHYLIQRLFGWQNSHLHSFTLEDEVFEKLTGGLLKNYKQYCGVYFRFPIDPDDDDNYWDDDYCEPQSFKEWLRLKYNPVYRYKGNFENLYQCQLNLKNFIKNNPQINLFSSSSSNKEGVDIDKAMISDVNLCLMSNLSELLERLTIKEILAKVGDEIMPPSQVDVLQCMQYKKNPKVTPLSDKLVYNYDFGENWKINIICTDIYKPFRTASCNDFNPICIARDGLNVLDDVGGITGYCDFLKEVQKGNVDLKEIEHDFGWSVNQISLDKML